jgi:CubicO group peptidase (beta-lactamase class C family)
MSGMSRRTFGHLAAGLSVLGLGGYAANAAPGAGTRLTQAQLDGIIGRQANILLNRLRSANHQPDVGYAVAVAFACPNQTFNPYYMYGDVGGQTPPNERSLFAIGSLTKTFTAALFANGAFMRSDCFDWDAGMTKYLTGYLGAGHPMSATVGAMTPRMLAQQTSGFPKPATGDQDGVGLFQTDPSKPPPSLTNAWNTHTGPPPGTCWEYSNLGFITLGFATVAAYGCAGQTDLAYSTLLRNYITQPLNMPDTVTTVPAGAPVVQGHPNARPAVSASGASDLKSSAADMHTWLLAHLGATGQSSNLMKGLAATIQPSPLSVGMCGRQNSPGPRSMGLAWQVEPGPPQIIWKDGLTELGGCACWMGMIPAGPGQQGLGIAILVNGYFDLPRTNIFPDAYGTAMLRQIAAAA